MFGTYLDNHRRKSSQLRMVDPPLSLAYPYSTSPPLPQHNITFTQTLKVRLKITHNWGSCRQNKFKCNFDPLHFIFFSAQTDLCLIGFAPAMEWMMKPKGRWLVGFDVTWLGTRVDLATACEGLDHKGIPTLYPLFS